MISGYSKTYSITWWRIGYSLSRKKWADAIGHDNDLIDVCAPAPLQIGVAAGIDRLGPEYYASLCAEFRGKRDLLCGTLTSVGLTPIVPQGSYYVLADRDAPVEPHGRGRRSRRRFSPVGGWL